MINIVTYLWDNPQAKHRGRFEYGVDHVNRLYRGFEKHYKAPFLFTLITDNPTIQGLDKNISAMPLWEEVPRYRCYPRLRMFGMPELGDEILACDLDVLLTGDVTDLINSLRKYDFCAYVDRVHPKQFSNSFIYFKPRVTYPIWDMFQAVNSLDEGKMMWVGSDQGWLNSYFGGLENLNTFNSVGFIDHAEWDIYDYPEVKGLDKLPDSCKMVMFNGMVNDMSIAPEPWVKENWN